VTHIDASTLSGRAAYQLLIDTVLPRPVAWITTRNPSGSLNLAPFSFWNGVCGRPPIVSVAISAKIVTAPGGVRSFEPKQTAVNLRRTREAVVHLATVGVREAVEHSALDHPLDTDLFATFGLTEAPCRHVSLPRAAELPVALECRLHQELPVGEPPTSLMLLEVLGWHVRDDLVQPDGRIVGLAWQPLARLGVEGYAAIKPAS
jgi:flavin reductase (DIM6/NTAB) family NADH-FMN oxidoreductase RutF